MTRNILRSAVPVALVVLSLTACGRSQHSSENVVPVATSAPATSVTDDTTTDSTGSTGSTVPVTTTAAVVTVDPAVDQALAELEELTRQIESDLKAGGAAAANGG
ncbi:MAG TPA: hypothetical protein PLV13_10425 [Ilumatobacteraceae bacterium]|nr:hypothetical protein [Ilumatobacteraceae bacterium]